MTTPCYIYTVFDFKVHSPNTDGMIYYDRHLVPAHTMEEAIELLKKSPSEAKGRRFINTQWAVEAVSDTLHYAVNTLRDHPLSQYDLTRWIETRCHPYKEDGQTYPAAFVEVK